jgi:peptidyl-prolyl cis-trans isomerase C
LTKILANRSGKLILLLVILATISTAAYWLTRSTPELNPLLGIDALTNADSEALQQRINSQLFGAAIIEPPGIGVDIDSTTDTSAMQAKLAGLTKNVTTQQLPSADQLAVFYTLNKQRYRNPSKFWLQVVSFATAKHGGRVFQQAEQALLLQGEGENATEPQGDQRDQYSAISSIQLEAIYGQSFIDSLMETEPNSIEGTALPCWHGPISSALGAHLVCVDRIIWGDYPPLDEVENQLINDWRFSSSREALD